MTNSKSFPRFRAYVWEFYGPGQIYGHFFGHNLTLEELDTAIEQRARVNTPEFCGDDCDSLDRELVRDIMLASRGKVTEYNVKPFLTPP